MNKLGIDEDEATAKVYGEATCPVDRRGVLRMANIYADDLQAAIENLLQEK